MTPQPITLLNTGLPVVLIGALTVALPHLLQPKHTLSQTVLARAIGLTALLLIVSGGIIFALTYALAGAEVLRSLEISPGAVTLLFAELSVKASLVWLPILALVWLIRAQGVERRRGEAMAKRGNE